MTECNIPVSRPFDAPDMQVAPEKFGKSISK